MARRRLTRSLLAVGAIPLLAAACTSAGTGGGSSGSTGSSSSTTYPVGTFSQALSTGLTATNAAKAPPGANVPCTLTAAHPYPVILVHGTFENQYFNWLELAPTLANAGYCVYTFNYGANANTNGVFYGLGAIAQSAAQLQTEVNTVMQETGATKVDIIGHSQGGMMPRYYINDLGGAADVNMLIGLAPSNYGTTLDGLVTLGQDLGLLGLANDVASSIGESLVQQEQGSSFLNALNATPTEPGVQYVVIETKDDEVVTPYTNAFLPAAPNVQNILLQDQCPADTAGHIGTAFDGVANQDILNALGADSPNFQPTCSSSEYGPGI
jgi:triacylglycerol esterase/lipase EstA (alpha/beta hydrolase family)